MLSREEFDQKAAPLFLALELRRKRHVRRFYIGVVGAAAFLAGAIVFPLPVLQVLQSIERVQKPLHFSDILTFRIFAVGVALLLLFAPILSYRKQGRLRIEESALKWLISLLGEFGTAKSGGIYAAEIRNAFAPGETAYLYPKPGIEGRINNCRLRIAGVALLTGPTEALQHRFSGLLFVCASGATPSLLPLETVRLASPLMEAETRLKEAKPDGYGWDERIYDGILNMFARAREQLAQRLGREELPAERLYRKKQAAIACAVQSRTIQEKPLTCNTSFYGSAEACLALIDVPHKLFSLGSLFVPLTPAQSTYLYDVMAFAEMLTRELSTSDAA